MLALQICAAAAAIAAVFGAWRLARGIRAILPSLPVHNDDLIFFQDTMDRPQPFPADPSSAAAVLAQLRAIPGAGLLRRVLALLQLAWPALAVRLACGLFLTPLPAKWPRRGGPWPALWRLARWPFEDASVVLYRLPAAADGPVVLLVHGWAGSAAQMRPLAEELAAQGLCPIIVELPAHGRSAGWQSTLPQFARAIDYVGARLAQEGSAVHAMVAHSLGASAAAFAAARGLPVARMVLLAPAASPRAYTRLFAQVFGLSERTRAAMQARIEAREAALMAQFEPWALGARLGMPVLIAHDRDDRVNPFSDGQAYASALPRAELLATEGLGHNRLLKDPQVLARVGAFLRESGTG
jgi:pimeloyl-ACP methyl ester carboxylesterase